MGGGGGGGGGAARLREGRDQFQNWTYVFCCPKPQPDRTRIRDRDSSPVGTEKPTQSDFSFVRIGIYRYVSQKSLLSVAGIGEGGGGGCRGGFAIDLLECI